MNIQTTEKGNGEIVRVGMKAAFDKSEGNGGICDEQIGKEVRGKMGLMSVFGMRG
jgi:hypothetical protein